MQYRVPLTKPHIDTRVRELVVEVLDSGYLTEGAVTAEFERLVADYLEMPCVLAVTSATTGLDLALRAIGVGPDDEVIVPDFTYPATASIPALLGAKVILCDVDRHSMTLCMEDLERNLSSRTKLVVPVSAFGNPINYDRLNELKAANGFYVVEDAAPALGARFNGRPVGQFADITVFSLHPRKFITTGEGGLVVTSDVALADWMASYKRFGMRVEGGTVVPEFEMFGSNYKLSNVLAAIGVRQMEIIDELLEKRLAAAAIYDELLSGVDGVDLTVVTNGGLHSRQSYIVFVENRDQVLSYLRAQGIEAQIGTYALHRERAFARSSVVEWSLLENSSWVFEHSLALPLFADICISDQRLVVGELQKAILECVESPAF